MISVLVDSGKFEAAGLTYSHEAGSAVAFLTIPSTDPKVKAIPTGVSTDGTNLFFFPERSAAQRNILKILGVSA